MSSAYEAAQALSKFVNGATYSELQEFAKVVTNDHRTLQQGMMKAFVLCINNWSEDKKKNYYDLRNEATVQLADELNSIVINANLPYI